MTTQIFESYAAFKAREDKRVNGVSPEFAKKYSDWKEMNSTNIGCRDCLDCLYCCECRSCRECEECDNCRDCEECEECENCRGCWGCWACWECRKLHS